MCNSLFIQDSKKPLYGLVFLIYCFFLPAGCTTKRVLLDEKPLSETRLFVTRAGNEVTLAWDTRAGLAYTVMYNHTRSAKSPWKILPGFDRIRGTGRRVTYKDNVPSNESRYYRLHAFPAVSFAN